MGPIDRLSGAAAGHRTVNGLAAVVALGIESSMATSKQKQTVVEQGTELNGVLKSGCSVMVHGSFEGEIQAPELSISGQGAVQGTIRVDMLVSEGTVAGMVEADQVQLSGTVRSDTQIRASDLEVRLEPAGDKLEVEFGECTLDVGADPAEKLATDKNANAKLRRGAAAGTSGQSRGTR